MHLQETHLQNPSPLVPHLLISLSPNSFSQFSMYTKDKESNSEVTLKHIQD